jgi:hypothetical protein
MGVRCVGTTSAINQIGKKDSLMRKLALFIVLSAVLGTGAAHAAQNSDSNSNNNDTGMMSSASRDDMSSGLLKDSFLGIKPAVGVIAFTDPTGSTASRAAAGLLVDGNLARILPESMRFAYFGVQSGAIYSHLGSTTSNLFGSNADSPSTGSGANMLLIPADLAMGYVINDNARIGVHGGGNVIYRSVANVLNAGASSGSDSSVWRIFPNVGADFDLGLGRNVSLGVRPDLTLTPGVAIFTGTLGLGINLG